MQGGSGRMGRHIRPAYSSVGTREIESRLLYASVDLARYCSVLDIVEMGRSLCCSTGKVRLG